MPTEMDVRLFEHILNFRDATQTTNARHPSSQQFIRGRLYRSARPDEATQSDKSSLLNAYKFKSIIDLRTDSEHLEQTNKHAASSKHREQVSTSPLTEPSDPARPLRIPGIKYFDISLNGSAYRRALIKQLTWGQTAKLAGLYVTGYRKEAISVLGTNVMAPRGLVGLARDSLIHSQAEVKEVFDVLADDANYPILVHCTQGKDRTGLVVLLVLLLLGAPLEAIEEDYVMSERELAPEREEKLNEVRSIGLPDEFAGCPKHWVEEVARFIQEEFGGVERYLEKCGVGVEVRHKVRQVLTAGR
ncbi:hypothetical protein K431DRAFT_289786 [Polychaeton citri CBS 116435]|uniref:Tyrosine specific protein phosphatases domain-containing protein n=1 Tax=Polychaeton citri CBS 116435 TaxID=1314669 RepID=A0A9P4UK69_9PEZI|nr:hypothetical protein K431DRAFT_289786 [Polychaeton citri CBS 116435]